MNEGSYLYSEKEIFKKMENTLENKLEKLFYSLVN